MHRVVITGLGAITPLGVNMKQAWSSLLNGESGISHYVMEGFEKLPCKVAGIIPADFQLDNYVTSSQKKYLSRASILGIIASDDAMNDAGFTSDCLSSVDTNKFGVSVGVSTDYIDIYETGVKVNNSKSHRKVSPFFVPRSLTNTLSGTLSHRYNLLGPNHSISTACATGLHSIGDAFAMIARGACEVMLAGAADSTINPIGFAGFSQCKALSTHFNEHPSIASRPFDKDRDGFVISEGSGMVVLETLAHALVRKAPQIYAEVVGYGMSGDAYHITAPHPDGIGAKNSMIWSLEDAHISKSEIGYINAHATSTPLGDAIENQAIKSVFGSHAYNLHISSIKGATGHLLIAAGAFELAATALAVYHAQIPPTINLENKTDEFDLDYTSNKFKQWSTNNDSVKQRIALSNSFGFGGTNASLCLREFRLQ